VSGHAPVSPLPHCCPGPLPPPPQSVWGPSGCALRLTLAVPPRAHLAPIGLSRQRRHPHGHACNTTEAPAAAASVPPRARPAADAAALLERPACSMSRWVWHKALPCRSRRTRARSFHSTPSCSSVGPRACCIPPVTPRGITCRPGFVDSRSMSELCWLSAMCYVIHPMSCTACSSHNPWCT
jgi:hypothetical protein